jgi:hypothetical protein
MENKFDRRRKYYMVLDCETATLPYAINFSGSARQAIAIGKPLIYDLGWQVIDRQGRVYARKHFLISEIFSVPAIFNTAYYASKRPLYIEMLNNGEVTLTDWNNAVAEMVADMAHCCAVGAYNSMFDFKKAIPFTELYISKLYSNDFYEWEAMQNKICDSIAKSGGKSSNREFDPDVFRFRGVSYPLFDLWGMSCEHLLNNDEYKRMCIDENWTTASGKYFKTSAETAYRFMSGNMEFDEAHTALDDAIIESELFAEIVKKKLSNLTIGITYFPFRILGTVENFNY